RMSLIGITIKNNASIQTLLNKIVPNSTGVQPFSRNGSKSYKSRSGKLINVIECPVNITIKNSIVAVNASPLTVFLDPYILNSKKIKVKTNKGVATRNPARTISTTAANDRAAKKKK